MFAFLRKTFQNYFDLQFYSFNFEKINRNNFNIFIISMRITNISLNDCIPPRYTLHVSNGCLLTNLYLKKYYNTFIKLKVRSFYVRLLLFQIDQWSDVSQTTRF